MLPRKRAQPWLGTLIEIQCDDVDEATFVMATNTAFARVAHIHRVMSFHETTSDLQAIARCSANERVVVDIDTWQVLSFASQMEAQSGNVFNVTVARMLVDRLLLPTPADARRPADGTTLARCVRLLEPNVVHVLQPVWIDLGGVAKGYAVDAAVDALSHHGVRSGSVNAGGDLRVFGAHARTIQIRNPSQPALLVEIAELRELSCASSGDYLAAASNVSAIIGHRTPTTAATHASITVIALRCMVADALTKVLWLEGIDAPISRTLLQLHDAQAVALDHACVPRYA
jgi:FAD:protein FMN transferase